ncbi:tRNA preQ1(34) S-adenosylmethionine ribosyltransferase-isomerase QueA [Desulfospira joergensenii]|uniref:tRNA preQ1(34) S-adenosylmethionine ribosyltransferase-isomerase QueA n=1 Tax=Desulfospira joergensenii TaxID=53329 RepID=UPI0003B63B54|nr:tRNA preQ1(34) S-adenosylmethionine ribosyltransferase-isomerase QueA [Desulfospira joergensenii]
MYLLSDYDYDLPEERIAQVPCENRSRSRLMHLRRSDHGISHSRFEDLAGLLKPGDLLVVNNTRVVPARLFGKKETGGKVEVFVLDYARGMERLEQTGFFQCDCLVRASKSPRAGAVLELGSEEGYGMQARVEQVKGNLFEIRFLGGRDFPEFLKSTGQIPLPPYIKRDGSSKEHGNDGETYQTVYARTEGAVAAPTAGLHFTDELIQTLGAKGIELASLTLHVGYGTFVPVRCKDIREHEIHSELFSLSPETADKINRAKEEGRRVIAVGTTSVRTLEFAADEKGFVQPGSGSCDLYIYPGFRFKCVDAIITNFHLPRSTLLMLVSAFYDRERMIRAYETAVEEKYRFFSYGDAMLIE